MSNPWETENCDEIFAYHSIYPVPVAAALWCKIPPLEVQKYLDEAIEVTPGVWRHSSVKCLEVKCRAMHSAIVAGVLPTSRENGAIATDHVSPARRHVSRQHLKDWIMKEFPGSKPDFLFDELERKSHTAINTDTYHSLQADRDALCTENEKLRSLNLERTSERDALREENYSLRERVEKNNQPSLRSETTYLNIIGGLLDLMLSNSPSGKPQSVFSNQSAIISVLVAHHPNKPGISQRTLEEKFSEAKSSLAAT